MDRRAFLAAIAAGAVVTAEGLWLPGQKLISIPKVRELAYVVTHTVLDYPTNYFGPSITEMVKVLVAQQKKTEMLRALVGTR